MAPKFVEIFYRLVRDKLKENPDLGADDVAEIFRTSRASAGGHAKAANAAAGGEEKEIAAEDLVRLADTPTWEDRASGLDAAISKQFGDRVWRTATYDDAVIITDMGAGDYASGPTLYRVPWSQDAAGITFGQRERVVMQRSYVPIAADDDGAGHVFAPSRAIRLADEGTREISPYQHLHKIGEWAVEHGSGIKIKLTRDDGDTMIANFDKGVVRRQIPLDEIHLTGKHGRKLATLERMYWGDEQAQPADGGEWLCAQWRYNKLGREVLADEWYSYTSPEYHLNYVDKETGTAYGPAVVAAGATNDPYLRMMSFQGDPPMPAVIAAEDTGAAAVTTPQQPTTPTTPAAPAPVVPAATPAAPAINLEDHPQFRAMAAQLAEANRRIAEADRVRLEADIDRRVDDKIRQGVPPAIANKMRRILKLTTAGDAVIKLDDTEATPAVDLHAALYAVLEDIPSVLRSVGTVRHGDQRPAGSPADHDKSYSEAARAALAEAGITPRAAARSGVVPAATVADDGGPIA